MSRRERRYNRIGLPALALIAITPFPPAQAQDRTGSPTAQSRHEVLATGDHAEHALTREETHIYEIRLAEGHFLAASVVPRGIDVRVSLVAPDGQEILNSNVANDTIIAEHALAVAATGGLYELHVRAANAQAPPGSYIVTVETVRPATDADRLRAEAMRKLETGVRLISQADRDSRQRGLQSLEQSREGFREAGDAVGESWAAYWIAWVQDQLLSPDALKAAREAVALCRGSGDHSWLPGALFIVGMMDLRNAEVETARKDLEESLSLAQGRGDVMTEARARNALGIFYGRTGEAERAVEQLKLALELVRPLHWHVQEQGILNNLGIATKDLGDYKVSLDYYEQTLAIVRKLKDPGLEANALNNIGNLYRLLREYEKALEAHQAALTLARQVGNADHEGRALNALGWTYSQIGDYSKAMDYYQESLGIRRKINDPAGLASTLDGSGVALHKLGDDAKALEYMNEALGLRRDVGERYAELESLAHIAELKRDRGELDEALANIEAAVQLADALRGRVMSPDSRASFVAYESQRYDLYIDVLMRLARARPSDGFTERAFEASERGRARVLLESLLEAHTDIREGIEPALLEKERAALRRLDDASARMSRSLVRSDAKALESARAAVDQADAEHQQIEARIRSESPRYAALTQPRALKVEDIQHQLLDNGTLLLEFAVGEERSWLWVVTPTAVESFQLPPRAELERAGRRLYALLTARQPRTGESASARATRIGSADREWRTQAAEFSRTILGDAARVLGTLWPGKRLLIAPDGILEYLPFSALPEPLNARIPLMQRHEIANVPSASVAAAIAEDTRQQQHGSGVVAIVADPVFEADDPRVQPPERRASSTADGTTRTAQFARLPFSRQEALAISSLVPAEDALRAMDFDASRSLVTRGELSGYRIVHFATHGFLNSENPRLSGLMLSLVARDGRAQDGFLRLNDIYNLHLPADVVVLSACQTALGKEIRGEGLVGLTRGFMYAGARSVVASLWEVDDLATAELMKWFYRGMLKEGLTPAAALRAAQRRVSQQPQWSAPFFWSAFVLQGGVEAAALAPATQNSALRH